MKTMITNKAGKYLEKLLKGDPKSTLKIKIFFKWSFSNSPKPLRITKL